MMPRLRQPKLPRRRPKKLKRPLKNPRRRQIKRLRSLLMKLKRKLMIRQPNLRMPLTKQPMKQTSKPPQLLLQLLLQ